METKKQKRGEFIPIIREGIHKSWYNRALNITPVVYNNNTTANSSVSYVGLDAIVKYRFTSSKGRMYFPKNLDIFNDVYIRKHGNNYILYAKRYFRIHGEIDLQSSLKEMEEIRVCNTEFFSYIMEEYRIPIYNKKDEYDYCIELPF